MQLSKETYKHFSIKSENLLFTSNPCSQFLPQMRAFDGRSQLLYLIKTRLPALNDDSEDTVVIKIERTSHAMRDSCLNRVALFSQYLKTSRVLKASISKIGSSKYTSKAFFLFPHFEKKLHKTPAL